MKVLLALLGGAAAGLAASRVLRRQGAPAGARATAPPALDAGPRRVAVDVSGVTD